MNWKTIDRPGYFGLSREDIHAELDRRYKSNNWRLAWEWGNLILQKSEALQLYEDGYLEHFKLKPSLLDWLVNKFENVYDTSPSNVLVGFSYDIQETPSNHLHDVAIRRAVMRLGKWFSGSGLLEVRSVNEEGWILSPCKIPFHLPDLIYKGKTKYKGQVRDFDKNPPWWIKMGVPNSVEQFYQQNKVLQVRYSLKT